MIRYTPKRKAEIVEAALKEPSKIDALMQQHNLSSEELYAWCERLIHQGGCCALRATRVQEYRRAA